MKPCPFCAIARGEAAAEIVYQDDQALAFLDHSPLALGRCLMVPRTHVATLFDADPATLTALALAAQRLGAAIRQALASDGLFVAQNNVVSQSVPHLHTHLVPRRFKDGLFARAMVWKRVRYESEDQRAEIAGRIRASALLTDCPF